MQECEHCLYGEYDEEYEELYCLMPIDEDEAIRLSAKSRCPYFRPGDEYTVVKQQN